MTESGRGWAYVVLFSEIGISLLVTTLVGVLVGYWVDKQLGTLPVFLIIGFLVGAGVRDPDDRQTDQSVPQDIRLAGLMTDRRLKIRARRRAALLCVEQACRASRT